MRRHWIQRRDFKIYDASEKFGTRTWVTNPMAKLLVIEGTLRSVR